MIRLKRVYDPPEPEDGIRILATTYWPRGVRKDRVDRWYKELGTPPDLLKAWQEGRLEPAEFAAAYRESLRSGKAADTLEHIRGLLAEGRTVTLLTSFRDLERSHIQFLAEIIQETS